MKEEKTALNMTLFGDGGLGADELYDKMKDAAVSEPVKKSVKGVNYYIHKISAFNFKCEIEAGIISSASANARTVREIEKGDEILFLIPIISRNEETNLPMKKLMFVASSAVEEKFNDESCLAGYDQCKTKLKIAGLKFFKTPISGEHFINSLQAEQRAAGSTISDIVTSEYRRVNSNEYEAVVAPAEYFDLSAGSVPAACTVSGMAGVPEYIAKIFESCVPEPDSKISKKYILKDMIVIINRAFELFSLIKNEDDRARIFDLIEFVSMVFDAAGVSKSAAELKNIYLKAGRHIRFEHIHTRNAADGVEVQDQFGNISRYGYIKFRRGKDDEN
ncbi:MAG: hypothetical protein BWY32_02901 [bacterium ADurb.Bin243]|nr:MAG: hypothetical protein BWY32_02901 [bacterium ADurb.Bin243]